MALTLDNVVAGLRFGGFAPEGLSITCVIIRAMHGTSSVVGMVLRTSTSVPVPATWT